MIGLKIGHAADTALKSGVTVLVPDRPAVAAVHVAGGAPATRETDLLRPGNLVERVDALVLSGGSVHGLAAADSVVDWLAATGRGFPVAGMRMPIVPAAAIFDLANGGDKSALTAAGGGSTVYRDLAEKACASLRHDPACGSIGAGTGATTANLKGGFGIAHADVEGGAVLACAVVNAVGRVTLGDGPHFRAAAFETGAEFGGLGFPTTIPADAAAAQVKTPATPGQSTVIGAVVTDFALERAEALRLAVAGQDGIALSVFPAHTLFDGDTVFALATGERPLPRRPESLVSLAAAAAAAMARAVTLAVYAATPAAGDAKPAWRERHGRGP